MTNSIAKKIFASAVAVSSAFMGFAPIAAQAVSAGEVYKTTDGTVWFITSDMQRRPFTSGGAFLSYGFLSWAQVQNATAEVEALTAGSFIAPQDGKIFCATATKGTDVNGECSLVTGGMKAAFTSSAVFSGLGYSFSRAQYGDSSFLTKTANLDNAGAAHSAGVLVNIDGTVYLVGSTSLMGIPSVSVFESWGYSFLDVVTANSADRSMTKSGIMASRTPGHLSPSTTADSDDDTSDCNVDGDAGDLTLTTLSTYANEDVGEGEEEIPVLAFDAEADEGSDVAVNSIKVELEQTTAADSDKLNDYIDEVVIMLDGDVVGSADAEDFTESSDRYSKSISLDDCTIIDAGEEVTFVVAITSLGTLDSGDINSDVWDVEIDSVRFEDGDGITTTETPAADAIDQAFDFEAFATSADINFKVSETDNDEVNEAHMIDVDDTEDTDGVEVLAFSIEIEGDSNVVLDALPVDFTMTATTITNLDDSDIKGFHLVLDGDEVGTADLTDCATDADCDAVGLTEDYTFSDLDLELEAGETYEFIVTVDMPGLDEDFDAGDTIRATLDDDQMDNADFDAEDENGDAIADGDSTGSAASEASAIRDTGILVTNFESSYVKTSSDTVGVNETVEFTMEFDITSFGENAYIDDDCIFDDDGTYAATSTSVSLDGDDDGSSTTCTSWDSTDADDVGAGFEVIEGQTKHFVVTVLGNGGEAGGAGTSVSLQGRVNSIGFAMGADAEGASGYTLNLDEYETATVTVFDR